MRRDLYYKKEVRREFENFGNLCCRLFGEDVAGVYKSFLVNCTYVAMGEYEHCYFNGLGD